MTYLLSMRAKDRRNRIQILVQIINIYKIAMKYLTTLDRSSYPIQKTPYKLNLDRKQVRDLVLQLYSKTIKSMNQCSGFLKSN